MMTIPIQFTGVLIAVSATLALGSDGIRCQHLTQRDTFETGRSHDISHFAAVNGIGFAVDDDDAFYLLDLSDPNNIIEIAFDEDYLDLFRVDAIFEFRGYLAIEERSHGVRVFDTTDPLKPVLVSAELPTGDFTSMDGDTLITYQYVSQDLVRVYDISDLNAPVEVGSTPYFANEFITGTMQFGNYAYIATTLGTQDGPGFRVLDASDPSAPVFVAEIATENPVTEFEALGDTLLCKTASGTLIFDRSNPGQPEYVGQHVASIGARVLELIDEQAFVTDGQLGLDVIDISNPANPSEIGKLLTTDVVNHAIISDSMLYALPISQDILSYDLSTIPESPITQLLDETISTQSVASKNDYIYLDASDPGTNHDLAIYHATAPNSVEFVGFVTTDEAAVGELRVAGDLLYSVGNVIQTYDISTPQSPVLVSAQPTPRQFDSFAIEDQTMIASFDTDDANWLLGVYDLSDPKGIEELAVLDTPGYAFDVALHNATAYIASYHYGVQLYNLSNPSAPLNMGELKTIGYAHQVETDENNLMYVADGPLGLNIYVISNPINPLLISNIPAIWNIESFHVDWPLIQVTDYSNYIRLFDISAPDQPELIWETEFLNELLIHDEVGFAHQSTALFTLDLGGTCGSCVADINADGVLDFFDVTQFIQMFQDEALGADLTEDGVFNFFDVSMFLVAYSQGCP